MIHINDQKFNLLKASAWPITNREINYKNVNSLNYLRAAERKTQMENFYKNLNIDTTDLVSGEIDELSVIEEEPECLAGESFEMDDKV